MIDLSKYRIIDLTHELTPGERKLDGRYHTTSRSDERGAADVRPRLLFVCTGNAGRSQIAQAMARREAQGRIVVESAGVAPWLHLHPMAVRIMAARGFDLAGHYPKSAESVADRGFDVVVTIGERARLELPARLRRGPRWIHWDISDPADADGTPESEAAFQLAADAIARHLPGVLAMF
jgi:protein-tyrosine-phosphatase